MFKQGKAGNAFFLFIVAGLFSVLLLSGCGHRGDLYLPDTTETTKQKKKAS